MTPTRPAPSSGPQPDRSLMRRLAWRIVLGVAAIMVILGVTGRFFREPVVAFSRDFVGQFGAFGVGLGIFLADAFPTPIWHEALMFFGLLGGLTFWTLAAWATVGSLIGGSLGFFMGRALSGTTWFRRFLDKRSAEFDALGQRYGAVAVAVGALSPLPFTIVCWGAGAVHMPYRRFLTVALLRFPRMVFYLFLIKAGVVKFFA